MDDLQIVELYWERSESAIASTAEKYGRYCHSIAFNILRDDSDAEECVNDTYLGAWNSIPPQRPNRLQAYLGRITRNSALNRYKRSAAEKRGGGQVELALSELEMCVPQGMSVEETVENRLIAASIDRFLFSKSREKRGIFVRRYWYLSSIKEIAGDFGMSESKVASMLMRMRSELKKHLEKEEIRL